MALIILVNFPCRAWAYSIYYKFSNYVLNKNIFINKNFRIFKLVYFEIDEFFILLYIKIK